jgi:hypothetical protein
MESIVPEELRIDPAGIVDEVACLQKRVVGETGAGFPNDPCGRLNVQYVTGWPA